ncbi:MAG: ribonuclease HIII [candidate division Zixibacteria bacterium]|nr:ribonuclease HIII [candidate division Zixibacteria bacterium]
MATGRKIIGVDEAGKGDFLGPLVVAGFLCSELDFDRLTKLGVRDSKAIAEKKLLGISNQLRALYPHFILIISPEKYNALYQKIKNLNKLLADCHADVIAEIASSNKADRVLIDKFGKTELVEKALAKRNLNIELIQEEKGERHLPVAAASILARASFVNEMKKLESKYGMPVPKGASSIVDEAARKLIDKHGEKTLGKVAKLHFKNRQRVTVTNLFA